MLLFYLFIHEEICRDVKWLAKCEQVEGLRFQCRLLTPTPTLSGCRAISRATWSWHSLPWSLAENKAPTMTLDFCVYWYGIGGHLIGLVKFTSALFERKGLLVTSIIMWGNYNQIHTPTPQCLQRVKMHWRVTFSKTQCQGPGWVGEYVRWRV